MITYVRLSYYNAETVLIDCCKCGKNVVGVSVTMAVAVRVQCSC